MFKFEKKFSIISKKLVTFTIVKPCMQNGLFVYTKTNLVPNAMQYINNDL